ncbi:MAG: hypothetical protein J0I07_09510 [Myxococcales bacterium]|nr:hypothetical protein [Myxococcales bacterium]
MRRRILLAWSTATLAALATLAACATSDGEGASLDPVPDGGSTIVDDASPEEVDATSRPDASAPVWSACNDHGWCETELPDPKLTFIDVWPFVDRAFAVAESDTLGTKVLEWTEATQAWSYIDDNSQNAYGGGQYAGKMYAPSENELYFTTAPGIVYHGKRVDPSAAFTWESARLPYEGPAYANRDPGRAWSVEVPNGTVTRYATALGVTGTSADDVYAWYGNRIFRRTSEGGGPPTWGSEFVTEDPSSTADESFYIFNASPASSDEIWFVGGHGPTDAVEGYKGCPTLFRRTPSGYSVVLEFTYASGSCATKPGAIQPSVKLEIPGYGVFEIPWQTRGWATAVAPVAPGAALVIVGNALEWYYVDTASNVARYNWVSGVRPPTGLLLPPLVHSVVRMDDRLWFSGHGIVFGSEIKPAAWNDGLGIGTPESFAQAGTGYGALVEKTSVAMKGRYLDEPLYQVRGTSAKNLWAVGNRYALHKKTP